MDTGQNSTPGDEADAPSAPRKKIVKKVKKVVRKVVKKVVRKKGRDAPVSASSTTRPQLHTAKPVTEQAAAPAEPEVATIEPSPGMPRVPLASRIQTTVVERAKTPVPRVVIADDSNATRKVLKLIMRELKFEVVCEAKNGGEAVEHYKRYHPDILFLDINMPMKTGEEALAEIMKEDADAIVFMMTSVSDSKSVEKCLQAGAECYIRKDTPMVQMKEIIREAWNSIEFED